jgi:hypothetical protein
MAATTRSLLLIIVLLSGLAAAAPVHVTGFSFNGVSNRFIAPTGVQKNVAFNCSDPFDSAGTVKIYDLRGHLVTTIPINAGVGACAATPVIWDGTANGQAVAGGVYIYVIAVESVVASGALVVVR